jgi:hypothetical protein
VVATLGATREHALEPQKESENPLFKSVYQTLFVDSNNNAAFDPGEGSPTGSAPTQTHAQVVTDFLFSTESLQRLTEGFYEVFLRRQADQTGLDGWVSQLQQGLPFLTIGEQIIASDEFYSRAAAFN